MGLDRLWAPWRMEFIRRGDDREGCFLCRAAAAKADIRANIATGLKLYELDNGTFPSTGEGLKALLVASSSAVNWNGPYLEKEPIDPWGREYKYKSPGDHRVD